MAQRPPFGPESPFDRAPQEELFRAMDGRLRKENAARRGFAVATGTSLDNNAKAGNLDGVYVTMSFNSAAAATQSTTVAHQLGRKAVGIGYTVANGPIQLYSVAGSNAVTRAGFGAVVWGGPVTVTAMIY